MQPFVDLCRSVQFVNDVVSPTTTPSNEQEVAEYAARMRTHALRITETLTPGLYRVIVKVAEQLRLDPLPECFVTCDPVVNASAPLFGTQHRPLVVLNSGLVQLLTLAELEFVIGHELGHLGCGHGSDIGRQPAGSEYEALHRSSEARAKEISADRVGLLAVRSLFTAAGVMVKLASGLGSDHVRLDIKAFLEQLRRDPAEVSREWELYHSHPSLPFRLSSLIAFSESDDYLRLSGHAGTGRPLSEVDAEIAAQLEQLGDGRLSDMQRERFDRTVAWAGAALIMNDGVVNTIERESLERLIGEDLAGKVLSYAQNHPLTDVEAKFTQSLEMLSSTGASPVQRFISTYRSLADSLGLESESTRPWPLIVRCLPDTK